MHWTNARDAHPDRQRLEIYNDEVLFGWLHFPEAITIGGEAQGALQWHFLAMWIFSQPARYLVYGLVTGRFRRKLLPIWPRRHRRHRAPPCGCARHADITHYNAVQRLLYVGIILVTIVQVISGLAIWKPVQFQG